LLDQLHWVSPDGGHEEGQGTDGNPDLLHRQRAFFVAALGDGIETYDNIIPHGSIHNQDLIPGAYFHAPMSQSAVRLAPATFSSVGINPESARVGKVRVEPTMNVSLGVGAVTDTNEQLVEARPVEEMDHLLAQLGEGLLHARPIKKA
jgi:hypothetical protein